MPVLVPLLIPFFAFAAALILIGLSQTHPSQHGTSGVKGFLDLLIRNSPAAALFGLAKKSASYVVSHFAAAQLHRFAKWLIGMGTLTAGWFSVVPKFTEAIVQAVERVYHATEHALARANAVGHALSVLRAHVNAELRRIEHVIHVTLPREIRGVRADVRHLTHVIDVTVPREIGRVRREEEALSRDLAKLRERTTTLERGAIRTFEWLRSHANSGAMTVFAGAVAVALARMGFGFLRCNNWKSLGKRITCGMGAWLHGLLDLIATFGLATLAVTDPEELAKATVAAVDTVEPILAEILRR